MNLRSLNLNLLVTFDAIYSELNITKAGIKLGLSQSSVSNALTRLRGHMKDDLFVRGPGRLTPTARAIELAEPIRSMLLVLEETLDPKQFDPIVENRVFTVASVDYVGIFLAPKLANHLSAFAPNVDIRIISTSPDSLAQLDRGEIDFAVGVFPDLPDRFGSEHLIEDQFLCLIGAKHPLAQTTPTIEQYAAMRHLLVSFKGDPHGFVDDELAKKGLTRRVVMTINSFAPAPGIVHSSDLVLTAPSRIIERFASASSYIFPCPVNVPKQVKNLELVWHTRLSNHAGHRWFRQTLKNLATNTS